MSNNKRGRDEDEYNDDVKSAVGSGSSNKRRSPTNVDSEAAAQRMRNLTIQLEQQKNNMQLIIAANGRISRENDRHKDRINELARENAQLKSVIQDMKSNQTADLGFCKEQLIFAQLKLAKAERERDILIHTLERMGMPYNHIMTLLNNTAPAPPEADGDVMMGGGNQYKPLSEPLKW